MLHENSTFMQIPDIMELGIRLIYKPAVIYILIDFFLVMLLYFRFFIYIVI